MKRDGLDDPEDDKKQKCDADATIFATQWFEVEEGGIAENCYEENSGDETGNAGFHHWGSIRLIAGAEDRFGQCPWQPESEFMVPYSLNLISLCECNQVNVFGGNRGRMERGDGRRISLEWWRLGFAGLPVPFQGREAAKHGAKDNKIERAT